MKLRHAENDQVLDQPTPDDAGIADEHAAVQARTAALAAVADDAIRRTLSGNSTKFLEQNRQAGGQ